MLPNDTPKLAICITTFLRDELLIDCIKSITDIYQDNWWILVADQGKPSKEKTEYFNSFTRDIDKPKVLYFQLPYDCGLSYARNFLVDEAKSLNIHYCLISADSIKFTYTMVHLNDTLQLFIGMKSCGIMGLNLQNRFAWEYDMELVEGKYFLLKKPTRIQEFPSGSKIVMCDMVKNFFLGKTWALSDVRWDNQLKLCEHEDFFWRFKQSGWKVCWTDTCDGTYVNSKPEAYNKYRSRMYGIYRQKLREKYNIKGWVKYEKER